MANIEVCFSPLLFPVKSLQEPYILVVIDVLRATTSICTAFEYGVKEIIPVATVEEALDYKNMGYIVAGERNGSIIEFADVGNSPQSFMTEKFKDKPLVFTTTNGTQALKLGIGAEDVVVGAFSNLTVLVDWLIQKGKEERNVMMLCSGWFNQFCLEDTVLAGCISEKLLQSKIFLTSSDAVQASLDLWRTASADVLNYMEKASHLQRLRDLDRAENLEYCFKTDTTSIIPILKNGKLVRL